MAKLTLTLPVYNAMPYLKDAVESVLSQTYANFNFLVIDDGSRDGSTEYLRSIRDPRLRLIARENRGLGATLNQLFAESDTDHVVRMDSDDVCAPNRLQRIAAFIEDNSDVVMAGSDQAFLAAGRTIKAAPRPTEPENIKKLLLKKRPGILHPTVVVRRDAWEKVGGYRLAGAGEDLDFCLRACDIGRVTNIPEVLYYYRLHASSISNKKRLEINYGYDFGVACAMARERGEAEPEPAAYREAWNARSIPARTAEYFNDFGQYLYRLSLVRRLEGRRMTSAGFMLVAAGLQPRTATDRVMQIASRIFHQRETKVALASPNIIPGAKFD